MEIYKDYLNRIERAVKSDRRSKGVLNGIADNFDRSYTFKDLQESVPANKLLPSLSDFASVLGRKPNFEQKLGLHPDFAHLKGSDQTEYHYIVSMFVDIKGSTNLFKKYDPETVLVVMSTVQRAAIHTFLIFGGYIHRLQGDGLFIYFGGKRINISDSLSLALQSASVFSYFVKNDLKKLFDQQGIEKISTRIGIDLGYDKDVIWAMAGLGEISEITTCSLHTSLASKMQSNAHSNGIVLGANIKGELPSISEYLSSVSKRTEKEIDRYIFQNPDDHFYYAQYDFNWYRYLSKQAFIALDLGGELRLKRKDPYQIARSVENLAPIAAKSSPYYHN